MLYIYFYFVIYLLFLLYNICGMNKIFKYNDKELRLESLQWHSKNYLKQFSDSLSMSKLEEKVKGLKGSRLQYVSGGYLYFNKENIDKIKYPSLFQIRKEFEEEMNLDRDINHLYRKVYHSLYVMCIARDRDNKFKDEMRIKILELKSSSYSSLAKEANVQKSNLYNYLVKEINSSLSVKKINVLYDKVR